MFLLFTFVIISLLVTFILFITELVKTWWLLLLIFIGTFIVINIISLLVLYLITFIFKNYKKSKDGKIIERKKPYAIYYIITYLYCNYINVLCGVKIIKKNINLIPNNEPILVVLNHQSILDPVIFFTGTKKKEVCFLMKKEIRKAPLLGAWAHNAGYYFVNRQNNREGLVTIINSINAINNGRSIGVFIEGTRSHGPNIGEFHDATLKMALKSKCKIVVCVVDNTYNIFKNFPLKRTKVLLKVCKVLTYEEYGTKLTTELGDDIKNIMIQNLEEERKLKEY